jgi:hypothetical protein
MSLDVSVYSVRISSGYLTTVAGGTVRAIGTSPYDAAASSGTGATGVVRTTGDQIASGLKIWDASTIINYDLSLGYDLRVGQNVYINGDIFGPPLMSDASNGIGLFWNPATKLLDVSIATGDVTKAYVDGSLGLRDVSIAWLATNKVNKTLFDSSLSALTVKNTNQDSSISGLSLTNIVQDASIVRIDSSINQIYTDVSNNYTKRNTQFTTVTSAYVALSSDNGKVIDASGSFTVTFPNNVDTGFQAIIINSGTGIITLNASTMLTSDSSVSLKGRYDVGGVVHKGSGVYYGFGNLR